MSLATPISYQLHIRVARPLQLRVGALGELHFPPGRYLYTGSARRNLQARVARHLRRDKTLRWHIDYLLAHPAVTVERVETGSIGECAWNRGSAGEVLQHGFGASDCRAGCGAHLRWLGADDIASWDGA